MNPLSDPQLQQTLTGVFRLVAPEIAEVRGKLCGFIKTEVVDNNGEFHSVADLEFHANN